MGPREHMMARTFPLGLRFIIMCQILLRFIKRTMMNCNSANLQSKSEHNLLHLTSHRTRSESLCVDIILFIFFRFLNLKLNCSAQLIVLTLILRTPIKRASYVLKARRTIIRKLFTIRWSNPSAPLNGTHT